MKTKVTYMKIALASVFLAGAMTTTFAANSDELPAMIPHDIASYQISPTMNACVMCHRKENSMGGAADVPTTHFTGTDGQEGEKVTNARYVCTSCHSPADPQ